MEDKWIQVREDSVYQKSLEVFGNLWGGLG